MSVAPNRIIPRTAIAQLTPVVRRSPLDNDLSGRDEEEEGAGSITVLVMTVTPEPVDTEGVAEGVGVPVE